PLGEADEIDDIGLDDLLAPELEGLQPAVAKHRPKAPFRFGGICPHPLGAGEKRLPRGPNSLTLPLAMRAGPSLSRKGRGVRNRTKAQFAHTAPSWSSLSTRKRPIQPLSL